MNPEVLPFLAMLGAAVLPTILSTVFLTVQLKERLGNVKESFSNFSTEMTKRFDQAGALFERLQSEVGRLTTAGEVQRTSQETLRTTVDRHEASIAKLETEVTNTRHQLREETQRALSELRGEIAASRATTPPRRR